MQRKFQHRVAIPNILKCPWLRAPSEWSLSKEKLIKNDTQGPIICWIAHCLVTYCLRCQIFLSANKRVNPTKPWRSVIITLARYLWGALPFLALNFFLNWRIQYFACPKVDKPKMIVLVNHNIAWFEISMNDLLLAKIAQSNDHLSQQVSCKFLC